MSRFVTLLTDFGTADGYAAAVRGVIASGAPHVQVTDATHDITPGDVHAAAWTLARYAFVYPPDTIHVVVVDPGVGSERRALAARIDDRLFIAPDNGVLTRALQLATQHHVVAIERPDYARRPASATFHGRDLFARAAVDLAQGVELAAFGPALDDPQRLDLPLPDRGDDGSVTGAVVSVDRFGNLITNVPAAWLPPRPDVTIEDYGIGAVRRTFADVGFGENVAYIGSDGLLEIAVRDGNAHARFGLGRGARVSVQTRADAEAARGS